MEVNRVHSQAQELAGRLTETIRGALPGAPTVAAIPRDERAWITAIDAGAGAPTKPAEMPIFVGGEVVATWRLSLYLLMDWTGTYLKTTSSRVALTSVLEKTPLVRMEFEDQYSSGAPHAHWQFHGERGAFSHLLARAGAFSPYVTDRPHSLSTLHFPVGGDRFRPCIEDFIEFLIRECGVDSVEGWEKHLAAGREIWRRMQFRAAVRDVPVEAAELLRGLGWDVRAPAGFEDLGFTDTVPETFTRW